MSMEEGKVFVFNKTKQTFLAYRVRVADSILSRLVGLLGQRSLEPDSGLWIFPSRGIHTLGMLFDIDVIFLDKDLKVVGGGPFTREGASIVVAKALGVASAGAPARAAISGAG